MPLRHPELPKVWLISDARNDAGLEAALRRLPHGSGLIFRHYHLPEAERRARFDALAKVARRRGHLVVLAGSARMARRWRADGAYGSAAQLGKGAALRRLVTVHSFHELATARRAAAVLLSPVFATRSHPEARPLGPLRFRMIAAHSRVPVIALGGMNARRTKRIKAAHWAGIDAFCGEAIPLIPKDS